VPNPAIWYEADGTYHKGPMDPYHLHLYRGRDGHLERPTSRPLPFQRLRCHGRGTGECDASLCNVVWGANGARGCGWAIGWPPQKVIHLKAFKLPA
jgi:hypothetical protein